MRDDLLHKRNVAPKGSCQRKTLLGCRRIVAQAVVETVTQVCDDHCLNFFFFCRGRNASAPASKASTSITQSLGKSGNCSWGALNIWFTLLPLGLASGPDV